MSHEEIFEKVKEIIVDKLGVEESQVNEEANFETDLYADSLDIAELGIAFEQEFGIMIDEENQDRIKTVGDVVKSVEENMGDKE